MSSNKNVFIEKFTNSKNNINTSDIKKMLGVGVYVLYYNNEPVYVGQSTRILYRIKEHIDRKQMEFDRVEWFEVDEKDLLEAESILIEELLPKYNETGSRAQARKIIDSIDELDYPM